MADHWIAVASADHVRRGVAQGFMQVCHGKGAPLKRIHPGSGIVYYSPSTVMGVNDRLQSLTAIGVVGDRDPYVVEMDNGVQAYRRDVTWMDGREISVRTLLDHLELTANKTNWGYQLRFGQCPISAHDFDIIAAAMLEGPGAVKPA